MKPFATLLALFAALLVSRPLSAQPDDRPEMLPAPQLEDARSDLPPPRQAETEAPTSRAPEAAGDVPAAPAAPPLRLADAIRRSLANVQTVRANIDVQTATVGRFEALKAFVPLVSLPQLIVGFRQLNGSSTTPLMVFPDVTDGVLLAGRPNLQQAALNRTFIYLPLDPSGHITALPVAEEGVRAKLLMEQLVRRSQTMLAIQHFYEAKQVLYAIRTALLGVDLAQQTLDLNERLLREKQAHDVEVTEARVENSKARVLLSDLEKTARITQRALGVVMHQSRLLVPQREGPLPIKIEAGYDFDLEDADEVNLGLVPDFPSCRDEAIELAKRQRVEVRILLVGLRIARLQQRHSFLGLFGSGRVPAELSFKNASLLTGGGGNGGTALGAIFGTTYSVPMFDVPLWSDIRKARLDVVRSQVELEAKLLEVGEDAGNSWDRWQQAIKEWQQREAELKLRHELLERQERLFEQKQAIWVEVLGARVNLLQADANRWTAWYNLQLARLDVLRSTEQLLDYVERTGIACLHDHQKPPPEGFFHRWFPWLAHKRTSNPPREGKHAE